MLGPAAKLQATYTTHKEFNLEFRMSQQSKDSLESLPTINAHGSTNKLDNSSFDSLNQTKMTLPGIFQSNDPAEIYVDSILQRSKCTHAQRLLGFDETVRYKRDARLLTKQP